MWFPYSSFQHVRQPSIPSPVKEDTSKIRDTIGTVFIQGPSIVLPVWRCIMFNDSYLRACMFLGCGFLIHLSNRSDSPRFRAPWKKIRQEYGIQQELSLFKSHPLSCQYGETLCSIVPSLEGLFFSPQNTNMNHLYSRTIHSPTSMEKHYVQWFILKSL